MSESSPMTDAKHTAEPWTHLGTMVVKDSDETIVIRADLVVPMSSKRICLTDNESYSSSEECEANAARLTVCVNALSGVKDPADFVKAAREFSRAVGIALSGDASDNWEQRIRDTLKAFRAAGGGETELNRGDAAD